MPHDTHIVRFKVGKVECRAMPDQQQYTIYYHRGDTSRSTPCYVAQNGVIDFSTMPEGAAIIHFKTGHGGRRFAPKYIQLRIEEYTRGLPRRMVGEVEVDCSEVLITHRGVGNMTMANSGVGLLTANFIMYGQPAKMEIAVLVYPENGVALSFDNVPNWNATHNGTNAQKEHTSSSAGASDNSKDVKGELKILTRGEAMTLLISLETLLERRRTSNNNSSDGTSSSATNATNEPQTKLEKRIAELEERRKSLTGSEGLATQVVNSRCNDVIAAQFTALAHQIRNNYIGETAAYFRQIALTSGTTVNSSSINDKDNNNDVDNNNNINNNNNYQEEKRNNEFHIDGDRTKIKDANSHDKDANSKNINFLREQLVHANKRINELNQQLRELDNRQLALGNLQDKVDVTEEVCANLEKITTLQAQREMLEKSRNSISSALQTAENNINKKNNDDKKQRAQTFSAIFPESTDNMDKEVNTNMSSAEQLLRKEIKAVHEEIDSSTSQQKELRSKIKHMTTVASGHVLTWARSKNPPMPSLTDKDKKNTVDDLFSDIHVSSSSNNMNKSSSNDANEKSLDDEQRKQVLTAFEGLTSVSVSKQQSANDKAKNKRNTGRSSSTSSSSSNSSSSSSSLSSSESSPRNRQSKHGYFGATDLPSMGDFAESKTKADRNAKAAINTPFSMSQSLSSSQEAGTTKSKDMKATYHDPNAPEGLGISMFANNDNNNYNNTSNSGSKFDFSNTVTPMPATAPAFEITTTNTNDSSNNNNNGLFGSHTFNNDNNTAMSSSSPYATFTFTNPSDQHSSTLPVTSSGLASNINSSSTTAANARKDDPYYDEMDDFTVPEGSDMPKAVIEFTDNFADLGFNGAGDNNTIYNSTTNNNNTRTTTTSNTISAAGNMFQDDNATSTSNTIASRPKFDFGPSDDFPINSRPTIDFGNTASFDFGNASNLNIDDNNTDEKGASGFNIPSTTTSTTTNNTSSNKGGTSKSNPFGWDSGMPTYNFDS